MTTTARKGNSIMNTTATRLLFTAAVFSAAFAIQTGVSGQTPPPVEPAKPAATATPAANPSAKPASMEEILAFLPDVIAEVNGKQLTKKDLIERFRYFQLPVGELAKDPRFQNQLREMIENRLIPEIILLDQAAAAGFQPSASLVREKVLSQFKVMPKAQQEEIVKRAKKDINTIADEFAKDPMQQKYVALNAYGESLFKKHLAAVTDADAGKYYEEHKDKEFLQPPAIRVAHILALATGYGVDNRPLPADEAKKQNEAAKKKIETVQAELAKGADFGALAEKYTDDPSGKGNKGQLPLFSAGRMVPEFEKAAFALQKPGDVSPVVKTPYGYHIIKLIEKRPATPVPLTPAFRGEIKERIAAAKVDTEIKQMIDTLKKAGKVKSNLKKASPAVQGK